VLRHLLSHFPHKSRQRFLSAEETAGQSTLLTAALSLDLEEASRLCDQVESTHELDQLTFESLMSSDPMVRAVWRNDYFRFFNQAFCRDSKDAPWHKIDPRVQLLTQEEFLSWDGLEQSNLGDYLGYFSHSIRDNESGAELLRFGNAPMVIRLRFSNKRQGLGFYNDLFAFDLRIVNSCPDDPSVFHYRCIAVVRLRGTDEGHDTLRLYSVDGDLFHPSPKGFPWSDEWRVHDGGQYMLFFVRMDIVPTELSPLSESLMRQDAEDCRIITREALSVLEETRRRRRGVMASKQAGSGPPRNKPTHQSVPSTKAHADLLSKDQQDSAGANKASHGPSKSTMDAQDGRRTSREAPQKAQHPELRPAPSVSQSAAAASPPAGREARQSRGSTQPSAHRIPSEASRRPDAGRRSRSPNRGNMPRTTDHSVLSRRSGDDTRRSEHTAQSQLPHSDNRRADDRLAQAHHRPHSSRYSGMAPGYPNNMALGNTSRGSGDQRRPSQPLPQPKKPRR
jgi:hypothetical protein